MDKRYSRILTLQKRIDKIKLEINSIQKELLAEHKAQQCEFRQYSNQHCLLEKHDGPHRLPCNNSGAHGPHKDINERENYYVECKGFAFDRT